MAFMDSVTGQRLRSACNECHASKVKCSGERTGCRRCIASGYDCQFEVSMVGRCSKGRRRRKRSPVGLRLSDSGQISGGRAAGGKQRGMTSTNHSNRITSQLQPFSPPPESIDSTATTSSLDHATSILGVDPLHNWDFHTTPDPDGLCGDGDSHLLFTDGSGSTSDDTFSDALARLGIPCPTEDYTSGLHMELVTSSSAIDAAAVHPALGSLTPDSATATTALPFTSEQSGQPESHHDSSGWGSHKTGICILFKVMSNLEAEMGNPSSTTDRIMHTVKTSTKKVQQVIESREWQLAVIGPMLALDIVEIALILIESLISRWDDSKVNTMPLDGSRGADHQQQQQQQQQHNPRAVCLGQYRAESEEAVLIWRHVVIVELRRLCRLIDIVRAYLDDSSRCHNSQLRPTDRLKSSCAYQEQKAGFLIATLQRHDHMAVEGGSRQRELLYSKE